MDQPPSLDQQIISGLEEVDASPHFGSEHFWLTFYLCGSEQGLATVAATLTERGWINASGRESGFIYPKTHVRKSASEILQLTREVQKLCGAHEAKILNIDADTSPDVQQSKFVTLFRSPA